ncbi:MAG: hypothetical protein AAGD34_09930 [Pseudomonadota bacterium]
MVEMTDFYSVLQRAVASLPDGSGPQRRAVYDKARKALLKQLQSFDPPLPSSDVTAQRLALEDAIRKIENEIARQIRTRRAVQGAMPGANAGATAAAGAGRRAAPQEPRETDAEREARRREEAARAREQQAEMLEDAVSRATFAPEPEPLETPPVPVRRGAAPDPAHDGYEDELTDVDFEEDAFDEPEPRARRRRGRREEPAFAAEEYAEEVPYEDEDLAYDHDEMLEPAEEPVSRASEKRRKKEEAKRLKAERRSRKTSRTASRAQTVGGEEPRKRSVVARAALPLVVLVLLIGASYAAYTQRAELLSVLNGLQGGDEPGGTRPPIASTPTVTKNDDRLPTNGEEGRTVDGEETRAVTTTPIRIGPNGTTRAPAQDQPAAAQAETPAPEARTVGTEVSPFTTDPTTTPAEDQVAAVDQQAAPTETPPAAETAAPSAPIADFTPNDRQQAVLYEEAAQAGEQGSAVPGSVQWSMVRQSIGGGDPEPVVRATTEIADRNMTANITIRENRDGALPASHLIEIEFQMTDAFEGGGVKNVPGIIMKETEQSRGEPLRGAAARVSSGLFWIALSEDEADKDLNLRLLRERNWIDIPILYESGRRAILTLQKGNDGLQSVNAAIQAWSPG